MAPYCNVDSTMSHLNSNLVPRSPFAGLSLKPTHGRGVVVCDRDGLGIAAVLVRKGKSEVLAPRVREHFRIELPRRPCRSAAGDVALLGTGPGAWLATCERDGNAFAISLTKTIGDLASISDQSDGYAVARLSGLKVRDTLSKLVAIDLHPRFFKPDDVACTVAAHIGAILWRLDDCHDGSPVFEIAVFRSLAASFWRALSESAAEFGLVTGREQS
jgi:heterotetrameric sarcosine oxidase gamma subunit